MTDKVSAERMERATAFLSDRIIKKGNGYLLAEKDGTFGAKGKDEKLWGYSELMTAFAGEEVRLALESAKIYGDTQKARADHNLTLVDKEVGMERERCAKAMCRYCDLPKHWQPATKRGDEWLHSAVNVAGVTNCFAFAIWERARERRGER